MKLSVLVATASALRKLTDLDCRTGLCNRARRELCASDGKTYPDECSWKKSFCDGNQRANTLLDFGSCQEYEFHCREKLAKCPKIYRPVCGSNGITFGNSCAIDHHNCIPGNDIVTEAYKGECKKQMKNDVQNCYKSCKNNDKEKPVCGSDGKTYKNRCYLENGACDEPDLSVVSKGPCPEEPKETENEIDVRLKPVECPSFCNRALNPVCGSNYKTYANECVLRDVHCTEDERLSQIMEGPCGCPKLCPATMDEVCGSDGRTYSSPCHLARVNCGGGEEEQRDVEFAHWGACSTIEAELVLSPEVQLKFGRGGREPMICDRMYRPVCATNGRTYANDCVARSEGATVDYFGVCGMVNDLMEFTTATPTTEEVEEYVPKSDCPCHRALILVCGENGHTYGNECLAECDGQPVAKWCACEEVCAPEYEEEDYDPELGEPEEEEPALCACNRMFKPVCSKSGRDFSNDCLAECEGEEIEFDCACDAVNNGKCPDMLNDFGFGNFWGGFAGFGGFGGFENDFVEESQPEEETEEAEEEVDRCYQNCRRVQGQEKCGLIKGEYKNFKNWCELDVALCKNGGKDVTETKVCGMKRNGNFKIFATACVAEENNASVVDMSLCDDAREYNEAPAPRKGGVFKPWKLRLLGR